MDIVPVEPIPEEVAAVARLLPAAFLVRSIAQDYCCLPEQRRWQPRKRRGSQALVKSTCTAIVIGFFRYENFGAVASVEATLLWHRPRARRLCRPTGALLSAYFADTGKTGSLPTSRSSCWMITVALRLAAIFLKRSSEPSVYVWSVLNIGTPLVS